MSVPKVGYELINGMKSLNNLFQQLEIALEGYKTQKSFGYEWLGYYVLDKQKGHKIAWVGTYYDGEKVTLTVEGEKLSKKVSSKLPKDFLTKDEEGNSCVHSILDLESSYYFCLPAEKQLKLLRKWLEEKLGLLLGLE